MKDSFNTEYLLAFSYLDAACSALTCACSSFLNNCSETLSAI